MSKNGRGGMVQVQNSPHGVRQFQKCAGARCVEWDAAKCVDRLTVFALPTEFALVAYGKAAVVESKMEGAGKAPRCQNAGKMR